LWFFFSSRRRHTRFSRDWSSDVCSSDLVRQAGRAVADRNRLACPRPSPAGRRPSRRRRTHDSLKGGGPPMTSTKTPRKSFGISFEFFPPRSPDMEGQLWDAVCELGAWEPDFVSVTYGAGGSTKAPTLATVRRLIGETPLDTAAHLTCVDATREDVHGVVEEYRASGVK